jgi:hypothetical protein
MNTLHIPSPRLYNLYKKKNGLHNQIYLLKSLINNVKDFNKMNTNVNNELYNNVVKCNFRVCLINDLKFGAYRYKFLIRDIKDYTKYYNTNAELYNMDKIDECFNISDYLSSNWMVNELIYNNWKLYYSRENLPSYGSHSTTYEHFYIEISSEERINNKKVEIGKQIIPFEGLPIVEDLQEELNELTDAYKKEELEIKKLFE